MVAPIGLLGGGAIGQLLAWQLQQQRVPLRLLSRPNSPSGWQAHQLTQRHGRTDHYTLLHDASPGPLQALLVTVKAQQVEAALAPVLAWLPQKTPIVLLHNGMGPQHALLQQYPERTWWWGTLSDGALRQAPHQVRCTGVGLRQAGPAQNQPLSQAPKALRRLGFALTEQIEPVLWRKLTVNALVNPVAARDEVINGALLAPGYRQELLALCQELVPLGRQFGVEESAEQCLARALRVVKATAGNRCSTLQDRDAGRSNELANITGFVLSLAAQQGVNLPQHQRLWQQWQTLAASRQPGSLQPA
ncbi:ketopantoate reductase family protein [Ferrimonas marina]|uniref:2-dehydropantoate 2-reductase n=1 Tax=Ferrimonas marina TaxID=299255 RepID=A0A1M5YI51_9GAMM|nr:2-dehydropantoate 2-reductase [Ferrimonas marina]SHI11539.1 2-dehydropantoate 2-reductase [Ferrimonas marina]